MIKSQNKNQLFMPLILSLERRKVREIRVRFKMKNADTPMLSTMLSI